MKYLIFLLLCSITIQGFPEKVSKEKAKKVAENWGAMSMNLAKNDIEKEQYFINKNDTSLFIFNFKNGGFVIVPADDHTYPILGYSSDNQINLDHINPMFRDWLGYYADMIEFNKEEPLEKDTKNKWEEIEESISLKSVQTTVPSLFETTQSSRWAYWRPYHNQSPPAQPQYYEGYNSCVPDGVSQIMKYFKYPLIGTGTGSGKNNDNYFTQNINCFFNYDLMPFRLTYCGNGQNNCNEGSFDTIPGVTQAQIDEVGKIQYMAGLAVGMRWLGMGHPDSTDTGTYNFTIDWVNGMADHFYYTPPTYSDYWDSGEITQYPSNFKSGLRTSLNSGYPVLFRYETISNTGVIGGHLVVIDGYENDNYFHFSMGFGGYMDA